MSTTVMMAAMTVAPIIFYTVVNPVPENVGKDFIIYSGLVAAVNSLIAGVLGVVAWWMKSRDAKAAEDRELRRIAIEDDREARKLLADEERERRTIERQEAAANKVATVLTTTTTETRQSLDDIKKNSNLVFGTQLKKAAIMARARADNDPTSYNIAFAEAEEEAYCAHCKEQDEQKRLAGPVAVRIVTDEKPVSVEVIPTNPTEEPDDGE